MHDEYAPYDPVETLGIRASTPDDTPAEVPETPEALPEFDPRFRDDFTGLIHIGALSRNIDFLGHQIRIRTLKSNELLAIGEITKPYLATLSEAKAYTQAVVSMAVMTVDGQELPSLPLGDGSQVVSWAQSRFDWVGDQWHDTVVGAIYNQYLVLAETVNKVIEAMGKASGQPEQ